MGKSSSSDLSILNKKKDAQIALQTQLKAQLEEARANNQALSSKIDALREALKYANLATGRAYELNGYVERITPGEWWGHQWDEFEKLTKQDVGCPNANSLAKACNTYSNEINSKILEAQSQYNILADVIGGLMGAMEDAKNQINSLLNQIANVS